MTEMRQLDDALLLEYMQTFYGYGNLAGKYWFVGMEEGSNGTITEIEQRLQQWEVRGKWSIEDIIAYHGQFGITHFFGPSAKIQPTWNKLIRVLLSAEGHDPHTEMVRQFQRSRLGTHSSNNCLLELLPLPAHSTAAWIYHQHSQLPELKDRGTYRATWMEQRATALKALVNTYKPAFVVFYSVNGDYQSWWKMIADASFTLTDGHCHIADNGMTVFAITKHPVTKGITSAYFHKVGRIIKQRREALINGYG